MTITYRQRAHNLGLSGGCLWLIAVGTVYSAWSLLTVRSALATSLLAAMCLIAVGLCAFGIATIRGVRQLPFVPPTSEGRRIGWKIARQFWMIFAAEGAAIAVVSIVCTDTHHWSFIVPLILIIVGLHFLPLARLFAVPRYNVMGALFCVIPVVTMLSVPASAHIGHSLSWITIPAVGCAFVSLATAWAGLNEVRRFVRMSRACVD
jgi:hypothetical protein